jgi:hypothetical protein
MRVPIAVVQQVRQNCKRRGDQFFKVTNCNLKDKRRSASQVLAVRGGDQRRKYLPHVFTEHDAIVAATILHSTRAVETHASLVSSRNLWATMWP